MSLLQPALLVLSTSLAQGAGDLRMVPEHAELRFGARVCTPVRVEKIDTPAFSAGDLRITFDGSELTARRAGSADAAWHATIGAGRPMAVLAVGATAIYLCAEQEARELVRVRLADGAVVRVGFEKLGLAKEGEREIPVTLLELGDRPVLLSASVDADEQPWEAAPKVWHVTRLAADLGSASWTRALTPAASPDAPRAALFSARRPFVAGCATALEAIGSDVLVVTGSRDDLVRLDGERGETRASLARAWEYERGFIGPSVWCHYLSRFGLESLSMHADEAEHRDEIEEARRRFDERIQGFLTGGPIVVSADRIVLAVARAPDGEWASYLAETQLLELDGKLEPLSLSPVPRAPIDGLAKVDGKAVVWACDGTGLLRLETSTEDPSVEFGSPGGYDALGDLRWFERIRCEGTGWLRMDPAAPGPCFGEREALFAGGGCVPRKGDHEFRFPLACVDLATGDERQLELRVPFDGEIAPPEANYRKTNDGTNERYEAFGWYGLGLVALEPAADALACTLTNGRDGARIEFAWRELLSAPAAPR